MSDRHPQQAQPADTPDDAFVARCLKFLDGEMNADEFSAFQDQLAANESLRQKFVELNLLSIQAVEATQSVNAEAVVAMADLYAHRWERVGQDTDRKPAAPDARELLSFAKHVAVQSLSQKAGVLGAIAAVLLLSITLYLVFAGENNTPQSPETANNTANGLNEPTRDTPAAPAIVATLTAERDAIWERRPGDDLYAGQRLTLTAGIAEITTQRGAVAMIQAPATVELLESNNAIRLHTGRLVGICETDTSKGFLVRTPHMDIIDLGTRFGVDSTAGSATEVHVFTGSVEAKGLTNGSAQPQRILLKQGQATRASASNNQLVQLASQPQRFATIDLGKPTLLGGTGIGLSVGEKDPSWQVIAIGNDPLDEPAILQVAPHLDASSKLTNAVPGVRYLRIEEKLVPDIERYINDKRIRYTVRHTLQLPSDFEPAQADIEMSFEAENRLLGLRINGQSLAVPSNQFDRSKPELDRMTIPRKHLKPGPNTIEVEVEDLIRTSSYVWGFGIAWQLETTKQEDS